LKRKEKTYKGHEVRGKNQIEVRKSKEGLCQGSNVRFRSGIVKISTPIRKGPVQGKGKTRDVGGKKERGLGKVGVDRTLPESPLG